MLTTYISLKYSDIQRDTTRYYEYYGCNLLAETLVASNLGLKKFY